MGFCHLNLESLKEDSVEVEVRGEGGIEQVRGQREKGKEAEERKHDGPAFIREVGTCSGFLSSMKPDLWENTHCRKADLLSWGNEPHGSWNVNVPRHSSHLSCHPLLGWPQKTVQECHYDAEVKLGRQTHWFLTLALASRITLGKSLTLFTLSFFVSKMGLIIISPSKDCCEDPINQRTWRGGHHGHPMGNTQ